MKLINSLILSTFGYCSNVYFNFITAEFKNKIQRLQNACLRFAYSISRSFHVTPIYLFIILTVVSFCCVLVCYTNFAMCGLHITYIDRSLRFVDQFSIPIHHLNI